MTLYKLKKAFITSINIRKSERLKDKIIVFESDDWGSIRTPSAIGAKEVRAMGGFTSEPAYLDVDTLENEEDVDTLFDILLRYKDEFGNHPKITANYVVGNPDFEKIRDSNFEQYFCEPCDQTYIKYFGSNQIIEKVKQGNSQNIFIPQFHGREHVNIPLWLSQLKAGDKAFLKAFDFNFFGIQTLEVEKQRRNVQVTFELDANSSYLKDGIIEGLRIFENLFGFKSLSFIPNNYVWDAANNYLLAENGVKFMQGVRVQAAPIEHQKRILRKRFGGQREENSLISIVRNGIFEPSFTRFSKQTALERCLDEISTAFLFKQPAVISTHRLNFVSGLDKQNRLENHRYFELLLKAILKKWPDVKFMSTVELGHYYENLI